MPDGHARRLLFDRLVDSEPWDRHDRARDGARTVEHTLDRRALMESVRRELERLFSCRTPLSLAALEAAGPQRTVVDYGVPELSSLAAANPEDRRRLAAVLGATVAAYEPRLREVRVSVEPVAGQPRTAAVGIRARLRVDTVEQPVWFPLLVAPGGVTAAGSLETMEGTDGD